MSAIPTNLTPIYLAPLANLLYLYLLYAITRVSPKPFATVILTLSLFDYLRFLFLIRQLPRSRVLPYLPPLISLFHIIILSLKFWNDHFAKNPKGVSATYVVGRLVLFVTDTDIGRHVMQVRRRPASNRLSDARERRRIRVPLRTQLPLLRAWLRTRRCPFAQTSLCDNVCGAGQRLFWAVRSPQREMTRIT